MTTYFAQRIYCHRGQAVHIDLGHIVEFQFSDYAWECSACGGTHCSQCGYETDGETVIVSDCGRFDC